MPESVALVSVRRRQRHDAPEFAEALEIIGKLGQIDGIAPAGKLVDMRLHCCRNLLLKVSAFRGRPDENRALVVLALALLDPSAVDELVEVVRDIRSKVAAAVGEFALKRLGLDGDPSRKRPQDQHIVLVNRREVREAMGGAQAGE